MQIFETHAHLYFPNFSGDLDETLARCADAQVAAQVQIGCDETSSLAALELARARPNFFAAIGIHPTEVLNLGKKGDQNYRCSGLENYQCECQNFDDFFDWAGRVFEKNSDKIVAFGETGFDRFRDQRSELLAAQTESFQMHLRLSQKYEKPIIIHSRAAAGVLLNFLATQKFEKMGVSGVVHCFCDDTQTAKILTEKYGFFLGIGGILTYSGSDVLREVVRQTPIEFLITETDSPFLVPQKARSGGAKRNEPSFLPEVVEKIAEIKKMGLEECAQTLFANAQKLFGVSDLFSR